MAYTDFDNAVALIATIPARAFEPISLDIVASIKEPVADTNESPAIAFGKWEKANPAASVTEAFVGSYRMSPLLGVGMEKFKNSVGRETEVERLISLNLRQDGIETTQLKVEAGLVTKIAPYRL